MGMLMSSFILLFCTSGNTFFLIILSMMSGTEMTMAGFTSAKAWAMMAGDGRRVRKNRWHPWQKEKMNSTAMPYMWAMGRMLSVLEPCGMCLPMASMKKSRLLHIALYGSITPLENPVVPLV